ncbi:MAG: SusC/RagA family TonB-linked outer membrane protein [Parabacteroides sp.]
MGNRFHALLLSCLLGFVAGLAQVHAQSIPFPRKGSTLQELFTAIEQASPYRIAYHSDSLQVDQPLLLPAHHPKRADVLELLSRLLPPLGYTYKMEGNYLIISPQPPLAANPQEGQPLIGIVTDHKGEPIFGANVVVKGTTLGCITDLNGRFTFHPLPPDAQLEISFIGYETQVIPVPAGERNQLHVELSELYTRLNEVVVIGYGSAQKRDLTTAVTHVRWTEFTQGAVNDPLQLIDGKVAGMTINRTAAADPNAASSIQVRGASSLKAGNSPLIVIDGMPGSDLHNIAQQDIESITVLKDGSAAAIYGSRGANGVILVQTKQGKAGKSTLSYEGYAEHDFVANKPQVLDPTSYLTLVTGATDYGYRTNWYDALLNKHNVGHNHHISLSGGSESSRFRLSANFRQKEGLDIATSRKEYGIRGNFKHTTLEGLLEVGGNFSYRIADEAYTDYSSFRQAVQLNPTFSLEEMDVFRGSEYTYNPVKNLTERKIGARQSYHTIDLNLRLNLSKGLYTELMLGRQGHGRKMQDYKLSTHRECINNGYKGRAEISQEDWTDWTLEWLGNYTFSIGKQDFKLMAGYSYQEFNYESFHVDNRDFPTDAFLTNNIGAGNYMQEEAGRLGMSSYKSQEKTIAFLGRVHYNYHDLLLFTASLRREGNSKFGEDHKWGLFPAVSTAIRLSQLPAIRSWRVLDDLKIRFSYGVTGRSGFDPYISLAKYSGFGSYWSDTFQTWVMGYGPGNNPNADLAWEKQISHNIGVDFSLLGSRLTGNIDIFLREGKDVIGDYNVPLPPYPHSSIVANVGTTTSKGFELQGSWEAIRRTHVAYSTRVTLSFIRSRLKSFSNDTYQLGYLEGPTFPSPGNPGSAQRLEDGKEIGSFYGFRYAGVDETGQILIWQNGVVGGTKKLGSDGSEKDKVYLEGTGVPKWELAWGNQLTYKTFDCSLEFRGRFRYKIMNQYEMYYGLQVIAGDNKLTSAYGQNAHIRGEKVVCDYFLQNGNYLQLDNITIGWKPCLQSRWISHLRLYAVLKNVFTITPYTGVSPTTVSTTGLWPGIGGMDVYPSARNLTLGIQLYY